VRTKVGPAHRFRHPVGRRVGRAGGLGGAPCRGRRLPEGW